MGLTATQYGTVFSHLEDHDLVQNSIFGPKYFLSQKVKLLLIDTIFDKTVFKFFFVFSCFSIDIRIKS